MAAAHHPILGSVAVAVACLLLLWGVCVQDARQDLGFIVLGQPSLRATVNSGAFAGSADDNQRRHLEPNTTFIHKTALVVYSWFEQASELENLRFFLKHGIRAKGSENIDFLIYDTTIGGTKVLFPDDLPNVRHIKRQNVGFDMCSYKIALDSTSPSDYSYFVFMNGSVRGPFYKGGFWLKPFTDLLQGSKHLAGTSINCLGCAAVGQAKVCLNVHLQSMFLVTDVVGVSVLNATLSCDASSKQEATWGNHGEIALSRRMLEAGHGIAALQPYWRDHNFLDIANTARRCEQFRALGGGVSDDPYHPNGDVDPKTLSRTNIDPEQVVMFKTNRNISPEYLQQLTAKFQR